MCSSHPGTRPDDPTATAESDGPSTPAPPRHARTAAGRAGGYRVVALTGTAPGRGELYPRHHGDEPAEVAR